MMRKAALLASMMLVVASFAVTVALTRRNTSGDFLMLWTGARLLGSDLYNWRKAAEIQRAVEHRNVVFGFVRLPIEALAMWPLGQLPIHAGLRIWQALNLCALLAFVAMWSPRPRSFLVAALFVPAWLAIALGQETCILLLLVGAGVLLIDRRRDFAGGFVLALCAVKPHLFLFVPVLVIAQRRWRALGGLLMGGAVIYALSAVIAGMDWPIKFLASVEVNRQFQLMSPGLSAAFSYFHAPIWVMASVEALLTVPVYRLVRGQPWLTSATCVATVGVLLAPWSFYYDLTLTMPALFSAMSGEFSSPKLTAGPSQQYTAAS